MAEAPLRPDRSRWPRLTEGTPGVPGVIRLRYGDFRVEEIPAYAPSGDGDHVFFRIEKEGLTTFQAVRDVARRLGIRPQDIGSAGLKDARAVTIQTLSVEHVAPERILALDMPRIRVLDAARNRRKLRTGHLRGNRFQVRLRPPDGLAAAARTPPPTSDGGVPSLPEVDAGFSPADVSAARRVLDTLARRGVPNYFGSQRFGIRGDTGAVGRALLRSEWQRAAALIAGEPAAGDAGDLNRARTLFQEGRYEEAAVAWPRGFAEAARLCSAMARTGGDARKALRALGRRMLSFYVSAYQSLLFNDLLALRLHELDDVRTGDLAEKHDSGALFRVEDAEVERPRAGRFEISATGPLFGARMPGPSGEPAALEARVLEEAGADPRELQEGAFAPSGGRRSLRARLDDASLVEGADELGPWLELRFALPAGAYATSVLEEVCKERLLVATAEDFHALASDEADA